MSEKIYWVKETALYRILAKNPEEAKEKFIKRVGRSQYLDSIQERTLYVSTGRWTSKQIEPTAWEPLP